MSKKQKIIQMLMSLVLIISLLAPAALFSATKVGVAHIDPALVEMADATPDQLVRVIIREAFQSDNPELQVVRLGGQVVRDMPMLQAFAAVVPAASISELGQMASINWVSLDAPVLSVSDIGVGNNADDSAALPGSYFLQTLRVPAVWELGYDGSGVTVVVVDSGITGDPDFTSSSPGTSLAPALSVSDSFNGARILAHVSFNTNATGYADEYGHGTHVAGIIAGSGQDSGGVYKGIAPGADLINLKIFDDQGMAYESDTVAALQWVLENKDQYNIRVVNLSIQSTVEGSYHESALDAAAEILWFNGIVVVAAAGNKMEGSEFEPVKAAPANDPFIITVGASNENGDARRKNDTVATFTSYGETVDNYFKPDIVAPGKDIISVLASNSTWNLEHPERSVLGDEYFRISGTSMSAPMVSGAVALLLQAQPDLTPDQVKYRLIRTAGLLRKAPYLDVYAAVTEPTGESANEGVIPHQLLAKMALIAYWASENGALDIDWGNVDWDAVNWNAVNWNAVNWNAVNWNAVNWNAVNWNAVNWNAVNWNAVNWNAVNWNAVNWNAVNWNAVNWNAVNWNAVDWNE